MITQQLSVRNFHILSDVTGGFKPIDALCQFIYKGKQISISTAGLSKGACQSEIVIYGYNQIDKDYTDKKGLFFTVEDAIKFIDAMELLTSFEMHSETAEILKEVLSKD